MSIEIANESGTTVDTDAVLACARYALDEMGVNPMAELSILLVDLAYMRGRTLNDAFIILDEAQNTTLEQMKMFLTRLGFGSKIVVTGDITQVDLPGGTRSGLTVVRDILGDVDDVHFAQLSSNDVVRHRLVADIVDAYARWDASTERPNLRAAAPRNGPPQEHRRRNRR